MLEIRLSKEAIKTDFCEEQRQNTNKWNSRKLAYSRHCKFYVERMYYPISYEITDEDIVIIKELQSILQKKFSRLGIVE